MTLTGTGRPDTLDLRRGDRVRLRPVGEIAQTLGEDGCLERLPFMAEMLALTGRELTVESRADKTCDTIDMTGCNRRMDGTVHIAGARCDGSAHGGCQAYCLLFFKEEWLERVEDAAPREPDDEAEVETLRDRLDAFADAGVDTYRCQATQLLDATEELPPARHYLDDLRTRNVPLTRFARAMAAIGINRYQMFSLFHLPKPLRYRDGRQLPAVRGKVSADEWPDGPSDLAAGDLVEVRSLEEIEATLDEGQRNRGLWFDGEMVRLCGRRGRILFRVERLIDEKTGRMLRIRKDLFVVSGMTGCVGTYHQLCTRSMIAMMRASWLRRID